jgi:hypothetical protein
MGNVFLRRRDLTVDSTDFRVVFVGISLVSVVGLSDFGVDIINNGFDGFN